MSPVSGLLVDGRVPGTRAASKPAWPGNSTVPASRPGPAPGRLAGTASRSISGRGYGALLAILVLEAGQVVPAGRLTGLL